MRNNIYSKFLSELRTSQGKSLTDLIHILPVEYTATDHDPMFLIIDSIIDLIEWKLVEVYKGGKLYSAEELRVIDQGNLLKNFTFYISKQALDIENAFGISFNLGASTVFGDSDMYYGYFPNVLVLMPFTVELKPIYDDHIKSVVDNFNMTVGRADDLFSNGSIMADVWTAIKKSKIIIADCTGRNPNVFYEIGIAHTLSKETILITQNIADIPFDLRHLRVITYQYNPRGMKNFEETLKKTINTLLKK